MGDHQCSQDFHSVQFSRSVSDSLQRNELQHTRFPSASPTPGVAQTHIHRVGDAIHRLVLCHPLLLLPSIFPSIRVFSNESVLHNRWQKYWSFSFSISPSNEYSRLISFRIDWFDLFVVQGTLKSSPASQFKSINSSVLSFLYGSTLKSIHDHWKNHSFVRTDFCWQSYVSVFQYVV